MRTMLNGFLHEEFKNPYSDRIYNLVGVDISCIDINEFLNEVKLDKDILIDTTVVIPSRCTATEGELLHKIRHNAFYENRTVVVFVSMEPYLNAMYMDLVISKNDLGQYIAIKNRYGRTQIKTRDYTNVK